MGSLVYMERRDGESWQGKSRALGGSNLQKMQIGGFAGDGKEVTGRDRRDATPAVFTLARCQCRGLEPHWPYGVTADLALTWATRLITQDPVCSRGLSR